MEINTILTFIAVATLLVISPGPNSLLITKTVSISETKAGFANIGGFVTAFYLHGTLSILGISLLLVQSAAAFSIFKLLGAAYLIWIGVKALIEAYRTKQTRHSTKRLTNKTSVSIRTAFVEGFLTPESFYVLFSGVSPIH